MRNFAFCELIKTKNEYFEKKSVEFRNIKVFSEMSSRFLPEYNRLFACRRWLWIPNFVYPTKQLAVLAHHLDFLNMHLVQIFWITLQHNIFLSLRRMFYCTPFFVEKLEYGHKFSFLVTFFMLQFFTLLTVDASCGLLSNIWAWLLRRKHFLNPFHDVTQEVAVEKKFGENLHYFKYEKGWKDISGLV